MSHAALLSGKYDKILYNDIEPLLVQLIKDALAGKFNYKSFKPDFITKERFDKEKDTDGYIKYIWSFGNNGKNYLYSKEREEIKRLVHDLMVFGKADPKLEVICKGISKACKSLDIKTRRLELKRYLRDNKIRLDVQQLERLERLQQLERLERLQQLERLEIINKSYDEVPLKNEDIIYCDIPYEGTDGYHISFNEKRFYDWAAENDKNIYFSSYPINDDRFELVWAKKHSSHFSSSNNSKVTYECLYKNKR